jgi:pimeloyl-ACP methyl ester carboxylesterase
MFTNIVSSAVLLLLATLLAVSTAYPHNNTNVTIQSKPYTIDVKPSVIAEVLTRVRNFHETKPIDAPDWFDGPPVSKINAIAKYWAEDYDWYKVQDQINKNFTHFYTTVPSPGGNYGSDEPLGLHFIHQRSEREDAIPILFLHGWPSTSLEWEKVILPLAYPEDNNQQAFHVVAPDLPGFGFSPAAPAPGLGPEGHAAIFASLMAQLGYDRYVLYSSDLGAIVGMSYVVDYADRLILHATDLFLAPATADDTVRAAANLTTAEETSYINAMAVFFGDHSSYSAVHSMLPLSVAYALNDSPVGFLAWRYQVAYTVSDVDYSFDELITEALLLYLPGVYGNIRAYKELFILEAFNPRVPFTVPTAVLQFGGVDHYPGLSDINFAPRAWIERTANLTYFKRHALGGHFPALGQPQAVMDGIRAALNVSGMN